MSFYIALNGLKNAQTDLEVISHNIANVETNGFKKSRTDFADIVAGSAFTNPKMIKGIGATVEAITQNFTIGPVEQTGSALDIAIKGDGFFTTVSPQDGQVAFTRNGSFTVDGAGYITDGSGNRLQIFATPQTTVTTNNGTGTNTTGTGTGTGTTTVTTTPGSGTTTTTIVTPTGTTTTTTGTGTTTTTTGTGTTSGTGTGTSTTTTSTTVAATPVDAKVPSQSSTTPPSDYAGLTIGEDGSVTVSFADGTNQVIGKIALASFIAPGGLKQVGSSDWVATGISGSPKYGTPGNGQYGGLLSGALERSNVDIAEELVNLITAQRNFQANAKAIDTATQISQTVINLRS